MRNPPGYSEVILFVEKFIYSQPLNNFLIYLKDKIDLQIWLHVIVTGNPSKGMLGNSKSIWQAQTGMSKGGCKLGKTARHSAFSNPDYEPHTNIH